VRIGARVRQLVVDWAIRCVFNLTIERIWSVMFVIGGNQASEYCRIMLTEAVFSVAREIHSVWYSRQDPSRSCNSLVREIRSVWYFTSASGIQLAENFRHDLLCEVE